MNFLDYSFQKEEHYRETNAQKNVTENITMPNLWVVKVRKVSWKKNQVMHIVICKYHEFTNMTDNTTT